MSEEPELVWSSGNVFADLGLKDPDLLLTKAEIAIAITNVIRERGLTQAVAAHELGIDQAKVSALMRGRLDSVSLQRLTVWARRLGIDVRVTLTRSTEPARQGRMVTDNSALPLAASSTSAEEISFD
ncbi:MAG: helix-turn-helix domain-containing protein [Chloroflexota bacterium]|nr:helix-turn-helix domain-containing protein [Chloroflexota bacterium]